MRENSLMIRVENVKKQYRLGQIGGGTLRGENAAQDAFGMWESNLSITLASPDVDIAEVERVIEESSPIEKS